MSFPIADVCLSTIGDGMISLNLAGNWGYNLGTEAFTE